MPVITIIFYTGKEIWDGPRDLFDLLKVPENKKELLQKHMNNYRIHVIDARHMSDEEINKYSGDLKAFFIMLKEKYNEEMLEGVIAKHRETWYALSTIKKDKRYREYIETVKEFTDSKEKAINSLIEKYELTQETAIEKYLIFCNILPII